MPAKASARKVLSFCIFFITFFLFRNKTIPICENPLIPPLSEPLLVSLYIHLNLREAQQKLCLLRSNFNSARTFFQSF